MRDARGLTIIEVLIAIAIVLAMASLVVPNVAARFRSRAFEAAIDQTNSMLLMARAHAQMTRRSVEVIYKPVDPDAFDQRGPQLVARHLDLEDPDAIAAVRASAQPDQPRFANAPVGMDTMLPADDAGAAVGEDENDATTIREPWAQLMLSRGMLLQQQAPDVLETIAGGGEFVGSFDDIREPLASGRQSVDEVRLAVFLPDGSLLAGQTTWLLDDAEHVARIDINRWTGLSAVEWIRTASQAQAALDRLDDDTADDEDADDLDDDLDADSDDDFDADLDDGTLPEGS